MILLCRPVVDAPRLGHSTKPAEFYDIIERMYPDLPKIELFLRGKPRDRWSGWSNRAAE